MLVFFAFMSGRLQHLQCMAFAAVLCGMARQGHAQVEYRLTAGSTLGATDNSRAQTVGTDAKQADGFLMARAGAQLGYLGQLVRYHGAYAFGATTWARGTQSTSLTHSLNLASEIQTSTSSQTTLGAGATLGQLSLVDAIGTTNPQTVGTRPAGTQTFMTVEAREAFLWQFAAMWRLDQTLEGRLYLPVGDNSGSAQNRILTHGLGIARLWLRDQAGLRTRVGVIETRGSAPVGQTVIPGRESEFAEALLGWRHSLTPDWTSDLAAGAFVVRIPDSGMHPAAAGLVSVSYQREGQALELRAARTAEPNGYLGTMLERSLVSLTAGLTIGRWQALRLDTTASFEHDSSPGTASGTAPTANFLFFQAGARYLPGDMFMYRLQYTFRDQLSSGAAPGTSPFAAFRQQMVLLTVEVHYPTGP